MNESITPLSELIEKAVLEKPRFGDVCNHCGWCCLTEVCHIGVNVSGSTDIPCQFLKNSRCSLVSINESIKIEIGANQGCCAKTQTEAIQENFK